MKVVINGCYGGFGLSTKAMKRLKELGIDKDFWEIERNDPILVQVVEELGIEVNDSYSELKVVEIPENIDWFIQEYDGLERIAEEHRVWK